MSAGIILDLIIIAVIAICIFLSARRGFVRTLIEVVGFIAALIIAFTISSPLSGITYDKIIGPGIVSNVEKITSDGGSSAAEKIWNSLPGFITNNFTKLGISQQAFYDKVNTTVSSGSSDVATKISNDVMRPLIVKLVGAFYSTIIAAVLIALTKYLAKALNKLFKISVIGKINSILGGVIGIIKGLVFAFIFCVIVSIVITLTKSGFLIFTSQNIDSSNLFKIIYDFSPFV